MISILKKRYNLYTGNFYLEDMGAVFSISKMVFNRSAKDDVNMRVFEALSCGSLLVTNHIEGNGQDLLFRNRAHLIAYKKKKDLIDSVDYYLRHEKEREEIAARGREEVLKKHTYAQRVDYMLSFLTPHTAKQFHFGGVHCRGDEWVYEQAALAQVCQKGGRGIDVGCGPRKIVDGAIGIDILRKESRADILSSGDALPLADGKLDYVVASHNLEHYEDVQRTLREWKRVLRKGGILGVVVPDDRIIDTLSLNPQHKHALTPSLLGEQIRENQGWEIEILQEIVDAWSFGCICRKV
jgi:SAM-dependent methyltransferase